MNAQGFVARGIVASALLLATCGGSLAERLALVIGNDDYANVSKLQKAVGDARVVKQALERLGFKVTLVENADRRRFGDALDAFEAKVSEGDEVVLHYSGHGISVDGRNLLLPVDVEDPQPGQERRIQRSAYDAGTAVEGIRAKQPKYVFAVLDACRNNPFQGAGRSVGMTRGLARMEAEPGAFFLFSAGPGETALDRLADSDPSKVSVFTRILVEQLETPGLTLQAIAKATQRQVRELAMTVDHRQFPDYSDRTTERVVLLPAAPAAAPKQAGADSAYRLALLDGSEDALHDVLKRFPSHPRAKDVLDRLEARADDAAFAKAKEADSIAAYEAYINRPNARHADLAKTAVARLTPETRTGTAAPKPTVAARPEGPNPLTVLIGPDIHDVSVAAAAVSPDSRMVAAGAARSTMIWLWDLASGTLIRSFEGHTATVRALAFSPDGRILASGSVDQSVQLWDVETGELLRVMQSEDTGIRALAFSADGRLLASADMKLKLWDVASGTLVHTFDVGPKARPQAIAFSRDGQTLAAGGADGTIRFWDVASGEAGRTFEGQTGESPQTVTFGAGDKVLITHAEGGFAKFRDIESGKILRTLPDKISAISLSLDGRTLAVLDRKRMLNLVDPETGKVTAPLGELPSENLGSHFGFSSNGRVLITSTLPGTLWVRDAASGQVISKFLPLPDGEWAAGSDTAYVTSEGAEQHLSVLHGRRQRMPVDDRFKERWLKERLPTPAGPSASGECKGVTC